MHSLARKKLLLVTLSVMILSSLAFAPKAKASVSNDLFTTEKKKLTPHLSSTCLSSQEKIKTYKERIAKFDRYFKVKKRSILFSGVSFKDKFLSEYHKWLIVKLAQLEDEFKAQCVYDSDSTLPVFP